MACRLRESVYFLIEGCCAWMFLVTLDRLFQQSDESAGNYLHVILAFDPVGDHFERNLALQSHSCRKSLPFPRSLFS